MGVYRTISTTFWTDSKVEDEFTPEDKYFYLYLLTNPQTNICGCYEVSFSQMTRSTGYNKETIQRLLERFDKVHQILKYDNETKEILLLHWYKYNWSKSKQTIVGVEKVANHIKSDTLKKYVFDALDCVKNDAPYMPPICPMVASVSVSVNNNINNNITKSLKDKSKYSYKELLNKLLLEFNISDYLLESVENWIGYKAERNFKYKERGLKTLLKTISDKANQFGDDTVVNAINESISSGYQGIVWDNMTKKASANSYTQAIKNRVDVVESWV